MKKNTVLIIALFAFSSPAIIDAKSKTLKRSQIPQDQETAVVVKGDEPGFEDRQFKKKQLTAAENIDKFITAMLLGSALSQCTKEWRINLLTQYIHFFGITLKDHNGKVTLALLAAKLAMTVRRMKLLNRYVGSNPFYMIPSMAYFMVVDMASWTLK